MPQSQFDSLDRQLAIIARVKGALTDEWQTAGQIGRKCGLAPARAGSYLTPMAEKHEIERMRVSSDQFKYRKLQPEVPTP